MKKTISIIISAIIIIHNILFGITVYAKVYTIISPYEGTADCFCFGSWHLEDFKMTEEKNNYNHQLTISKESTSFSVRQTPLFFNCIYALMQLRN